MNDETKDKVNLFASGPAEGRTMHAHDEPPALSFQPGATFSPGASSSVTAGQPATNKSAEPEQQPIPNKISNKLDGIIADAHDEPIKSSVQLNSKADTAGPVPVTDIAKKSVDGVDKPSPIVDDKPGADLRQDLEQTYSTDRDASVADMPVQSGAKLSEQNDPKLDDKEEKKPLEADQPPAVKLNNVAIKDISKPQPAKTTAGISGFPAEDHLAGNAALTADQLPAKPAAVTGKAGKAGKRGLKFALVAVLATLVVGIGGAMAYSPTRTKIVAIVTGKSKPAAVNTNTPSPSPTAQAEQKNDSNYSVSDYLNSLNKQSGQSGSGNTLNTRAKANYAANSSTATATKKLTTSNLPTTVAPSVVGSLFPDIPATQIVNDYIGIESPCFETILPKDNQPFYNDWCLFGATYGAQKTSNLQVLPYTAADKTTFDSVIAYFKSGADSSIKLASEASITVGGVAAQKLVFTGAASADSFPDVMVLVDFGKDRYTKDSLAVHGFIIAGSYKDDYSKKNFDAALERWSWK